MFDWYFSRTDPDKVRKAGEVAAMHNPGGDAWTMSGGRPEADVIHGEGGHANPACRRA